MAHIEYASITGLVGRSKPVELIFNRDVTLIYGPNGCGKTSILKILKSAMEGDATSLRSVIFDEAIVRIYSALYGRSIVYSIRKSDLGSINVLEEEEAKTRKYVTRSYLAASKNITEERIPWKLVDEEGKTEFIEPNPLAQWQHRFLPVSRMFNAQSKLLDSDYRMSDDGIDIMFADLIQKNWRELRADLISKVKSAQDTGLRNILRDIMSQEGEFTWEYDTGEAERYYALVERFSVREGQQLQILGLEDFKLRLKDDKRFKRIVRDIIMVEEAIEESHAGITRFMKSLSRIWPDKTIEFDDKKISVKLSTGQELGMSKLSSGEKHIVRILLEVLLAEHSTLIIDEPELSMHIDWQKILIETMLAINSQVQIIAATHSPEIGSRLSDEKIHMIWSEKHL